MKCCTNLYDDTFHIKRAEKEMRAYQSAGLKSSSRPLLELLSRSPLKGVTLLDVGGGVGALSFEILKKGASNVTLVDLSNHYVHTFLHSAEAEGWQDKVRAVQGDFLDAAKDLSSHDLLTMDKVICCYPNYQDLLEAASTKAKQWIAYSIPIDIWYVHLGHWIEQSWNKIRGNHFQTYVHPPARIKQLLRSRGFVQVRQTRRWGWQYVLTKRIDS